LNVLCAAFNTSGAKKCLLSALKGAHRNRGPFAAAGQKPNEREAGLPLEWFCALAREIAKNLMGPLSLASERKRPAIRGPIVHGQSVYSAAFGQVRRCCPWRTRQRLPRGCLRRGRSGVLGLFSVPRQGCLRVRRYLLGRAVRLGALSFLVRVKLRGRRRLAHLRYRCCPAVAVWLINPVSASAAVGPRYSAPCPLRVPDVL